MLLEFWFSLLMSTTRDQLGDSPAALYRRLWPHTILSGGRLPDLRSIVKRIAYVTWNGLANYGYEPDGYTFVHGVGRWMNSGARIVDYPRNGSGSSSDRHPVYRRRD